eukprot:38540-Prymnesium_polylepis.1
MGTHVLTLPGQAGDDASSADDIPLQFTASMCASPVGSIPTSLAPSSYRPGTSGGASAVPGSIRPGTSGGASARPGTGGGASQPDEQPDSASAASGRA